MDQTTPRRSAFILGVLSLIALAILARALHVQVINNEVWEEKANAQIVREQTIPASRGSVLDRNGIPLAVSEARYEIGFAPNEVVEVDSLRVRLIRDLELPEARVERMIRSEKKWIVLPGRYKVEHKAALRGIKGVYFTEGVRRFYPQNDAVRPLLGRINAEGEATGGIEGALDSLLRGVPGQQLAYRDVRGRYRTSEDQDKVAPVRGADVVLTIDARLQEIADHALQSVIDSTGAEGGDVVITDPKTGDILAAASRRSASGITLGMVTDPYEPGSIMKPFIFAALLNEGKIRMQDSIFAENGFAYFHGRRITDVHPYGWVSLREGLAVSSNVVVAKIAEKLTPQQQYDYMRKLGFGQPSGAVRGESKGLLRSPSKWSKLSQTSLAIGYEVNTTPLQMALAYGALGNQGTYMNARLVKEIRYADGRVEATAPSSRGQVFTPAVAAEIRGALRDVVTTGTGQKADLGSFAVGGKTGTSRAYDGRSYSGYYASFAGLFPIQDPLISIVVRVIRPQRGGYYGGAVAAPVARNILEALLSAESPTIDRSLLAQGIVRPVEVKVRDVKADQFRWRDLRTTGVVSVKGAKHGQEAPDSARAPR